MAARAGWRRTPRIPPRLPRPSRRPRTSRWPWQRAGRQRPEGAARGAFPAPAAEAEHRSSSSRGWNPTGRSRPRPTPYRGFARSESRTSPPSCGHSRMPGSRASARVLPSMASAAVQRKWTGNTGQAMLDQSIGFVGKVAARFSEIRGATLTGKRILDFGCGYGRFTRIGLFYSDETFGVDPSPDSIRVLRGSRSGRAGIPVGVSPGERFPFPNDFDLVLALLGVHASERARDQDEPAGPAQACRPGWTGLHHHPAGRNTGEGYTSPRARPGWLARKKPIERPGSLSSLIRGSRSTATSPMAIRR